MNEGSLHAALKTRYAERGSKEEFELEGFVVDIRSGEGIVEIQTGSFGAMGSKLDRLLPDHQVLVVHPIARRITLARKGMADRRSPKRGRLHDLFDELVSIPTLIDHPNFSLEVVMVDERRVKVHDPSLRRRRGGWRTVDRQLLDVVATHRFESADDLMAFLPDDLPETFTTADICAEQPFGRPTAQKIAYCLRALDKIAVVDRGRTGYRYVLTGDTAA